MIGVHIRSRYGVGHFMPALERFNNGRGPDAVLVVDPKDGDGDLLRSRFPNAATVGRVFIRDGEASNLIVANPQGAAVTAANMVRERAGRGNRGFGWWQWNNEILQRGALLSMLNDFTIPYIDHLQVDNLKAAIGCFSRGNPEAPQLDNGADWQRFYPAMRHGVQHGAVLLLHAYGAPGMLHDATWHLHRYEVLVRPYLPADLKAMPYLYGEYGAERPDGRREAWKAHYPSAAAYVADMQVAAHTLEQVPECRGACIYNLEGSPPVDLDWLDFEIEGEVLQLMSQVAWPQPAESTPIPPVVMPPVETEPIVSRTDTLIAILKRRNIPYVDLRGKLVKSTDPNFQFSYLDTSRVPDIAIHHSGGTPLQSWEAIARYHVLERPEPFAEIGYHTGVRDGVIAILGELDTQRAHVAGLNHTAIGTCVMGTYTNTPPAARNVTALRNLVAVFDELYGHQKQLKGHRDINGRAHTECPGNALENLIPTLRQAVVPAPPPPQWVVGSGVLKKMTELQDAPRSNEMYHEHGSETVGEKFYYRWVKSTGEIVVIARANVTVERA